MRPRTIIIIAIVAVSFLIGVIFLRKNDVNVVQNVIQLISPTPKPTLLTPPTSKTLQNNYHVFQTFNNCGPASLSMTLSYFGINVSQQTLGESLRPYQNRAGDNDDKSVTLAEIAEKSKEYGLTPYHRPNGNIELIKLFITYDIPVLVRTWTHENEDIGHFRVIKGYDDIAGEITQDDSLQGKNLRFTYTSFNILWKKFNYEYLVLVPKDKIIIAEAILGEDVNFNKSWQKAAANIQQELQVNPDDIYARFNLSVAYYHTRQFEKSVNEFEKVESRLPFRTLWYQIEPIQSYFELGNYQRVFQITDKILNNHNRAFSELYILRGRIYKGQGKLDLARQEFEKAVLYNENLKEAQDLLNSI